MVEVLQEINLKDLQDLDNVYVFFSANDYYKLDIIKSFTNKFSLIGAQDFDFFVFDSKDNELSEILTNVSTFPFLAPKKVVIYNNIETLKRDVKYIKDILNSIYISMYGIDIEVFKREKIKRIINELDKGEISVKDSMKCLKNLGGKG